MYGIDGALKKTILSSGLFAVGCSAGVVELGDGVCVCVHLFVENDKQNS